MKTAVQWLSLLSPWIGLAKGDLGIAAKLHFAVVFTRTFSCRMLTHQVPIPADPPTCSDDIRPPKPGYPPTGGAPR